MGNGSPRMPERFASAGNTSSIPGESESASVGPRPDRRRPDQRRREGQNGQRRKAPDFRIRYRSVLIRLPIAFTSRHAEAVLLKRRRARTDFLRADAGRNERFGYLFCPIHPLPGPEAAGLLSFGRNQFTGQKVTEASHGRYVPPQKPSALSFIHHGERKGTRQSVIVFHPYREPQFYRTGSIPAS